MKKKDWPKPYLRYYNLCISDGINPTSPEKWLKQQEKKNSSDIDLSRWNNARTAPTLWDKINKDIEYKNIMDSRFRLGRDSRETFSNRIEVRKKDNNR